MLELHPQVIRTIAPLALLVPAPPRRYRWQPWFELGAIALWGLLLLTYWKTGRLALLIHPAYNGLVAVAGFGLLVLAVRLGLDLWRFGPTSPNDSASHSPLLPPRLASALLVGAAVLGFGVGPQPLTSQKALQRGLTESAVVVTRSNPQAFRVGTRPEQRQILDWIRTLNVYPEPEAYRDQPVKVQGFVVQAPDLPSGYYLIARFAITCCAADAYPVGLPVKPLAGSALPSADTWLEVTGTMTVETIAGERRLVIAASQTQVIAPPDNPYAY